MKKWLMGLLLACGLLLAFFVAGLGRNPQELPSVLTGRDLPALAIERPAGYFLLNVWGSWCAQCHQEHAFLMELSREIPIVGLNWAADNPREGEEGRQFLARAGNPYREIIWQRDDLITDLGVYGAPETFLIGPTGKILKRYAGPLDRPRWQAEFQPLLER